MVHCFNNFGENIVLDINSNAVHIFDALSYDVLNSMYQADFGGWRGSCASTPAPIELTNKYSEEDIREAIAEINSLISEGVLFSPDLDGEELLGLGMTHVFKSLCLHMAHDCNMKCGYCFASEGNFGMQNEVMDSETARKAVDFIVRASKSRRNIEVDFFGGEPLLNFDVIREVVSYARTLEPEFNKKFRFTLTTNGLLLDDKITDYVNENMDNLVLSLDGRREVNDSMRKLLDDRGSYDAVLSRIKRAVERRGGKNYYIRGTYTAMNKDFMEDVLHIADIGFDQISVEPVVAPTNKKLQLNGPDLEFLKSQYEQLAKECRKRENEGKGFNFFHFMVSLDGGPCLPRRITGCGAGYEYAAVTPRGDIYPCHQFVGVEGMKIGNVYSGIDITEITDEFKIANVYNKEKCRQCWAKFYCSGGCAANAYATNGSIFEPDSISCELMKKRIECAIWLEATRDIANAGGNLIR